jgi:hypothetical protein
MDCNVGAHLRILFVERAKEIDKAIAERDSAAGERKLKDLISHTQESFDAWLESSGEWADHITSCDDCRDGGPMIWSTSSPVSDIAVATRTPYD